MEHLITFLFCFIVIYLLYLFIIVLRKKGLEAFKKGKQIMYFQNVCKIDVKKLNYKSFANALAITNAFIIATTVTIIELFNSFILKLIVGFVILIPLIFVCYYILGKIYKSKNKNK